MGKRNRNRNKDQFNQSAVDNNLTFRQYLDRLTELSISMFEWRNLPPTVDARYLELQLFETGCMVYFDDEVIGNACLNCLYDGQFDVYGNPTSRMAYSKYNNYQKRLNQDNSVVIWNNYLHTNSIMQVRQYALRLFNLDRIIDVNANAQKTPVMVQATEKQRLTMLNLYKEYDGNAPFIFGDNDIDFNGLKAISTGAPYICDKIYQLKTQIWNEALTYLGISNINIQKKERLITDEVTRNQGGTIASRYSRLESRREGVKKINEMFGTNIEVNYREDFQQVDNDILPGNAGADTTGGAGNE